MEGLPGREVIQFHYEIIKIWELLPEQILEQGQIGLLPFVPLTKGGFAQKYVSRMFKLLAGEQYRNIAAIAYNLATLVFQRRKLVDSLKWLKRRFYRMYEDILMNTPFTQEILRMGREEEHEKTLRMTHKTVTQLVHLRFPEIVEQAKKLVEQIEDVERL
jgi:hypothetical protein